MKEYLIFLTISFVSRSYLEIVPKKFFLKPSPNLNRQLSNLNKQKVFVAKY